MSDPKGTWLRFCPTQVRMYNEWLAERPQVIKDMTETYNLRPWLLYLLKTTGQRVTINSLHEDGTLTVHVLRRFNRHRGPHVVDFDVFGIKPEDLEVTEWEGSVDDGAALLRSLGFDEDGASLLRDPVS